MRLHKEEKQLVDAYNMLARLRAASNVENKSSADDRVDVGDESEEEEREAAFWASAEEALKTAFPDVVQKLYVYYMLQYHTVIV